MPHIMIVLILHVYINLLNLSWIKNVYFFRNMKPLRRKKTNINTFWLKKKVPYLGLRDDDMCYMFLLLFLTGSSYKELMEEG